MVHSTPNLKICLDSVQRYSETLLIRWFTCCCHIKIQQCKHPNSFHHGRAPDRVFYSECQSNMTLLIFFLFELSILTEGVLNLSVFMFVQVCPTANLARIYIYSDFICTESFFIYLTVLNVTTSQKQFKCQWSIG